MRYAQELRGCWAFRKYLTTRGNPCRLFHHGYADHVHINSEYTEVTYLIQDKTLLGKLESIEEKKKAAARVLEDAEDSARAMALEQEQIKATRAQISV